MKKKLCYLILIFAGAALWAEVPFQLFVAGNLSRVHPIIVQNRIYLPLEEMASLFHLKADINLASHQIILEPEKEQDAAMAPPKNFSHDVILLGKVKMALDPTSQKPLFRAKIKLFKANGKYNELVNREAIERWISKDDSFYSDTHGLVMETTSDSSGNFAFSKIPPGAYEIVAFYSMSANDIRFWWVPLQVKPKEAQTLALDLQTANRVFVKKP